MNKRITLSGLTLGVASFALSTAVWATSHDHLSWDGKHEADYMVTDSMDHTVKFLDGIDKGHHVSDEGAMHHKMDCMKGDKITNLHTNKSGIIKGVKHQGTVDVMTPDGKTVRYQYVTFKVKPVK